MRFRGDYAFLSNMYAAPMTVNGIEYTCVEAAFQSFKTTDRAARANFGGIDGKTAKKMGRVVVLRPDWEEIKEEVMIRLLRIKFSKPEMRRRLLATVGVVGKIVEENDWNDVYWGVSVKTGKGKNRLGVLLMKVRDELCAKLCEQLKLLDDGEKHYLITAVGKSKLSMAEVKAFIISSGLPVMFRFGYAAYGAKEEESSPYNAVYELDMNVGDVYLQNGVVHVNCYSGGDMF